MTIFATYIPSEHRIERDYSRMPFVSKRQLATCFAKELSAESRGSKSSWDCKEMLKKTKNPACLPSSVGSRRTYGCKAKGGAGAHAISKVYSGPRGGKYFFVGGVKVYVPVGSEATAIDKYGRGGNQPAVPRALSRGRRLSRSRSRSKSKSKSRKGKGRSKTRSKSRKGRSKSRSKSRKGKGRSKSRSKSRKGKGRSKSRSKSRKGKSRSRR